jgi:hypothetical protein
MQADNLGCLNLGYAFLMEAKHGYLSQQAHHFQSTKTRATMDCLPIVADTIRIASLVKRRFITLLEKALSW